MELSIIIVNYNVKFFLEQCLHTVLKAVSTIDAEIWVVDNHSTDDSLSYLRPLFPAVHFIENPKNIGFGAANNQVLPFCKGEFILFLNPDTLIPGDCLTQCLQFIRSHPNAGALGIRMLDGSGQFLPESKRAFPSPITAFCKLVGLSALFPRSARFNRYSLGHLNPLENHPVDVLAGAFMMVKRSVLDQTGAFDQRFFMYGEDIDLSYRIQKAGFINYYFAGSTIIHFKGESTRKGSLNYVLLFYTAMLLFVRKNYKGLKAGLFGFFIQAAIIIRGLISLLYKIGVFFLKMSENGQNNDKNRAKEMIIVENPTKIKELQIDQKTVILFCESNDFSWKQIIEELERFSYTDAQFRFHGNKSNSIVGSDSKETEGEALATNTKS
ncbi:MAG: glycosyltransferase family 2 protein [Bacteroidota bacterium]